MFFFIGGIQPKTVTLDERGRMCPACGLYQAKLIRVDHFLSLFFIPLIRVRKGEPVIRCERCGSVTKESGEPLFTAGPSGVRTCRFCGKPLQKGFRYCPHCGNPAS